MYKPFPVMGDKICFSHITVSLLAEVDQQWSHVLSNNDQVLEVFFGFGQGQLGIAVLANFQPCYATQRMAKGKAILPG